MLEALKRRQQLAALNRREQLSTNPFYEECRIVLPSPLPHVHLGWARPSHIGVFVCARAHSSL